MYTAPKLSDLCLVKKEKIVSVWFVVSFIIYWLIDWLIYLFIATQQTDNIKKTTKKIEKWQWRGSLKEIA